MTMGQFLFPTRVVTKEINNVFGFKLGPESSFIYNCKWYISMKNGRKKSQKEGKKSKRENKQLVIFIVISSNSSRWIHLYVHLLIHNKITFG